MLVIVDERRVRCGRARRGTGPEQRKQKKGFQRVLITPRRPSLMRRQCCPVWVGKGMPAGE